MSVIEITKNNFKQEVIESEKPVLLDFNAQWCGPCRMVAPILDEIAKEHTELKIGKIDVDTERDLAAEFKVSSIPTLVAVKDGKVKKMVVGVQGKEALLDMMKD